MKKILAKILAKYDESQDYLNFHRARVLTVLSLFGILAVLGYMLISNVFVGYVNLLNTVIIPLLFAFLMIVTLILVKQGYAKLAGNFIITALVILQIVAITVKVNNGLVQTGSFVSSFFYLFVLLTAGFILGSRIVVAIDTILVVIANEFWMKKIEQFGIAEMYSDLLIMRVDLWVTMFLLVVLLFNASSYISKTVQSLIKERNFNKEQRKKLESILSDLKTLIEKLHSSSKQLVQVSALVSQRASKQLENIERIAYFVENIKTSTSKTVELAYQTNELTQQAKQVIQIGENVLKESNEAFMEIVEKTDVVKQLANTTDLLAVNAAIEAARSGEVGKGFGVIAKEIRALADSAKAFSEQIYNLADQAKSKALQTKEQFTHIIDGVNNISEFMKQIVESGEIDKKLTEEIGQLVSQMLNYSRQNKQTADNLFKLANQLNELSKTLAKHL